MSDRRIRFIRGETAEREAMLAALDERTIMIRLPRGEVDHAAQLVAITATDLLGRIFPRIAFDGDPETPTSPELPPGAELLLERLELARRHGLEPLHPGDPRTTLAVRSAGPADLYADGDGWQSYLGTQPSR